MLNDGQTVQTYETCQSYGRIQQSQAENAKLNALIKVIFTVQMYSMERQTVFAVIPMLIAHEHLNQSVRETLAHLDLHTGLALEIQASVAQSWLK